MTKTTMKVTDRLHLSSTFLTFPRCITFSGGIQMLTLDNEPGSGIEITNGDISRRYAYNEEVPISEEPHAFCHEEK